MVSMRTLFKARSDRKFSPPVLFFVIISLFFTTSCSQMLWPWNKLWENNNKGGGGETTENYSPTTPAIEGAKTYSIALGGVAPGRDELVIVDETGEIVDFGETELTFEVDNDVVGLLARSGFDTFSSGSGAEIVPQKVGQAIINYYIDGAIQEDEFLVIVPPQSLIQMMIAEGSTQLTAEADIGEDSHVLLTSTSETANAIAWVTRNRVDIIGETDNHSLFAVDEDAWDADPTGSYYDAVITASNGGIYQYSPVDPTNPTNDVYADAEARSFLEPNYHRAYDQAVLTAAQVYAGITTDPTGEAFGFFSPTPDQWEEIERVYQYNLIHLTNGCGMDDSDFPAFAPIQILVHPAVWMYPDGRPSFVFIREKDPLDYAVVKTP